MKRTAFCKINLTLEILGTKRGDGFHDVKSVMHKIPLGDEIEISLSDGEGKVDFFCDSDVCSPEQNLAYRAAVSYLEEFKKNTGKSKNVAISLRKITPTGAGLGGGSADAACVLDMMKELLDGVSDEKVLDIASSLGSDVHFCLKRYMSAVCTGRGEICRSIDTLPEGTCIVVAKPKESINTKGIYAEYDKKHSDDYTKQSTDKMEKALLSADLAEVAKYVMNDFEEICIPRLYEIEKIKSRMCRLGAVCSQMSGSGSAVFGLFDKEDRAKLCFDELKKDGLCEVYFFVDDDFRRMYKGE